MKWCVWLVVFCLGCTSNIKVLDEIAPRKARLGVLASGGEEGDTGWWPSVVFDAHDKPHVSFCDAHQGDLKYATRIGDAWHIEDVLTQGAVGKYTSIAVNSKGTVAIAFYDQDRKQFRMAVRENPTSTWQFTDIAWGHEAGMGAELRFDAQDVPHVFYYTSGGKFVHAIFDGTEWKKSSLYEATGGYSARVDVKQHGDAWWLSFVNWSARDTQLYLGHGKLDQLEFEQIGTDHSHGWRSQISFDANQPRITYTAGLPVDLRVTTRTEEGWRDQRLYENVGNMAQVALSRGDLAIALEHTQPRRPDQNTLELLRFSNNQWKRTVIDPQGPVGQYLAIAADSKDRVLIAYYSTALRGLKIYEEIDP